MTLAELKKQALELEEDDRTALARFLVSNLKLDERVDEGLEVLWYQEADRRYCEYKKGKIKSTPYEEVFEKAFREFQ